jgi:hypothetical protein
VIATSDPRALAYCQRSRKRYTAGWTGILDAHFRVFPGEAGFQDEIEFDWSMNVDRAIAAFQFTCSLIKYVVLFKIPASKLFQLC